MMYQYIINFNVNIHQRCLYLNIDIFVTDTYIHTYARLTGLPIEMLRS